MVDPWKANTSDICRTLSFIQCNLLWCTYSSVSSFDTHININRIVCIQIFQTDREILICGNLCSFAHFINCRSFGTTFYPFIIVHTCFIRTHSYSRRCMTFPFVAYVGNLRRCFSCFFQSNSCNLGHCCLWSIFCYYLHIEINRITFQIFQINLTIFFCGDRNLAVFSCNGRFIRSLCHPFVIACTTLIRLKNYFCSCCSFTFCADFCNLWCCRFRINWILCLCYCNILLYTFTNNGVTTFTFFYPYIKVNSLVCDLGKFQGSSFSCLNRSTFCSCLDGRSFRTFCNIFIVICTCFIRCEGYRNSICFFTCRIININRWNVGNKQTCSCIYSITLVAFIAHRLNCLCKCIRN